MQRRLQVPAQLRRSSAAANFMLSCSWSLPSSNLLKLVRPAMLSSGMASSQAPSWGTTTDNGFGSPGEPAVHTERFPSAEPRMLAMMVLIPDWPDTLPKTWLTVSATAVKKRLPLQSMISTPGAASGIRSLGLAREALRHLALSSSMSSFAIASSSWLQSSGGMRLRELLITPESACRTQPTRPGPLNFRSVTTSFPLQSPVASFLGRGATGSLSSCRVSGPDNELSSPTTTLTVPEAPKIGTLTATYLQAMWQVAPSPTALTDIVNGDPGCLVVITLWIWMSVQVRFSNVIFRPALRNDALGIWSCSVRSQFRRSSDAASPFKVGATELTARCAPDMGVTSERNRPTATFQECLL
mmetsp:Transcript_69592/g.125457  ORF Transcript_69592/g.125457 Transcript_69592/m.125457 type:complete len:356 (+) Transcript_69592:506-1573(+)